MLFYHSRPRPNRAAYHVPTDPALESIVSAVAATAHAGDSDYGDPSAETDRPTAAEAARSLPLRWRSLSSSSRSLVGTSLGGVSGALLSVSGQVGSEVDVLEGSAEPLFPQPGRERAKGASEREQKFPLDGAITRSKEEGRKEGRKKNKGRGRTHPEEGPRDRRASAASEAYIQVHSGGREGGALTHPPQIEVPQAIKLLRWAQGRERERRGRGERN